MSATKTQAEQEKGALARIADISTKIREGIRNALPTGSEQYLTVMVPGKVVNFDDYWTDNQTDMVLPIKTELNQAMLCDDMPTLSPIQMGPTGRSVARSYANAISKLVPAGTTVGIDDGKPLTDDQRRYKQAMAILQAEVEDKDMSLVELYTIKQAKYTEACAAKTKAFAAAQQIARDSSKSIKGQRQAYDQWVQENAKTWRNYVQAAYMDWVITGRKEEVEFWFSVVDQDSAMARIEHSKEVMRWAVVQDDDGSSEFQKVKLSPSNWAKLCYEKSVKGTDQTKTVEWYTWEINRLEKTNSMLNVMKANPPSPPAISPEEKTANEAFETAKKELAEAMKLFRTAESDYRTFKPVKATKEENEADRDSKTKAYDKAKTELEAAQGAFDKANLDKRHAESATAQEKLLSDICSEKGFASEEIAANQAKINEYVEARKALQSGTTAKSGAVQEIASSMGIPAPLPEPTGALVLPKALMGQKEEEESQKAEAKVDFFTPITVEVSASSETKHSETSASSLSLGASASYGLFSASVSHEQSEAHSKATAELATASVKISMEVMRVDITRPWLRPELFYDDELVCGPQVKISPGFGRLRALMDSDPKAGTKEQIEAELQSYSIFPLYPTAFIVACNVVLEVSGSTSSLETYMNSSSSSTSVAVGYGPFAAGKGSYSKSSADQGSKCESTASGCRITIKSPQIIGWVSQMIPALPRVPKEMQKSS